MLRIAGDVVSVGTVLVGSAATPVGAVVAGATGALLDIAFERTVTLAEEVRDSKTGEALTSAFHEIREADAAAYQRLTELDPDAARQRMFGLDGTAGLFQSTRTYQNLDPGARAIIADAKVNILADALQREREVNDGRYARTQEQIRDIGERLTGYETELRGFKENTNRQIQGLRESQEGLRQAYGVLSSRLDGHSFRLATLERVAFDRLSPREKVAALRSRTFQSVVENMTDTERRTFESGLERAARVQDVQEAINDTTIVLGGLQTLTRVFGMEEQFARPLELASKGVQIANLLLTASSGSPLAIMSALGAAGGLFGGGGDASAAQYAALRREIQALRRDIYEMRREMYEYHRETMQTLAQISGQIDATYRSLYRQGQTTYDLVAFVERGVNELLLQDLRRCGALVEVWDDNSRYAVRQSSLNGILRRSMATCRDGIDARFETARLSEEDGGQSTVFFLRAHPMQPDSQDAYAEQIAKARDFEARTLGPTIAYAERYVLNDVPAPCVGKDVLFLALTAPIMSFGDSTRVGDALRASCREGNARNYRLFSIAQLGNPQARGPIINASRTLRDLISGQSVLRYGGQVTRLSSMWEFVSFSTLELRLRDLNSVTTQGGQAAGVQAGISDLRRVRDYVNVAIAQQNLLAGDILLPALARHIDRDRARPAADFAGVSTNANCDDVGRDRGTNASAPQLIEYRDALCLIGRNALLRQNFITYWTTSNLRSQDLGPRGTARVTYAASIDSDDPLFINGAFRTPRDLVWRQCRRGSTTSGWCFKVSAAGLQQSALPELTVDGDHVYLPLPGWQDLATYRPARLNNAYDELLRLRDTIGDRLATYASQAAMTPSERQFMFAGALAAASADEQVLEVPES